MRRVLLTLPAMMCATALALAAPASGATNFYIQGAGFGHGIGLSQYGAYGFAQHGWTYDQILKHYYTGIQLEKLPADREVRVLLAPNVSVASFSGATSANGHKLSASVRYSASRVGSSRVHLSGGGRSFTVPAPLRAEGPRPMLLYGRSGFSGSNNRYRGALEFRPGVAGGINAIDALSYDLYAQGVVPGEMPSSWSMEALKAQAVAARTYGLTTSVNSAGGFDQYNDTRSQVYYGLSHETARTNAAVAATRGIIATYNGKPAVTYYFSTSGGQTENIENSFVGAPAQPWLKSVSDPYDTISPDHRWGPYKMSMGTAASKLSGLVKGSFLGVDVVKRGRSPRVVYADVVGSRGRTRVNGMTLRSRFGLMDSWAYYTVIRTGQSLRPIPAPDTGPVTAPESSSKKSSSANPGSSGSSGGTSPRARAASPKLAAGAVLSGAITPAARGTRVALQDRTGGKWHTLRFIRLGPRGHYDVVAAIAGVYRVKLGRLAGPAVRVR
jgi:stage II sporulation protein D